MAIARDATPAHLSMLFEDADGQPIPRVPRAKDGTVRVADGVRLFDLKGGAEHFHRSETELRRLWSLFFEDLLARDFTSVLLEDPGAVPAAPLLFHVFSHCNAVVICPGELRFDGHVVDAVTHRREILISGDVAADERLDAVLDQLRILWEQSFGPLGGAGFGTFAADVFRQLEAQGGTTRLLTMKARAEI